MMTPEKEYLGIGVFAPPPQSQDGLHPDDTPPIGGSTSSGVTREVIPDRLVTVEQTALLQSNGGVQDMTLVTSPNVITEHSRGGKDDRNDVVDGTTMTSMNYDGGGDDDDQVLSLTLTPSSDNIQQQSAAKQTKKTFIPMMGDDVNKSMSMDNKCDDDDDKNDRSEQHDEVLDVKVEDEGEDLDKIKCVIDKRRCLTHGCDTFKC